MGGVKTIASWWHLELPPPALSKRTVSLLSGLVWGWGMQCLQLAVLAAVLVWAAFSSEQLFAFWENPWL